MLAMLREQIGDLIKRRRYQLLVHSCLYYKFDTNLISDAQYDKWGHQLADLQRRYPEIAAEQPYAEAFTKYDGSTGAFLPINDPNIVARAEWLRDEYKKGKT